MARRNRWSAALGVVALALLGLAMYSALAAADLRLGPIRMGATTPMRATALAATATIIMLSLSWANTSWRRTGVGLAILSGIVALAVLTRGGTTQVSTGDFAFLELYTRHAMHGRQLLGAYSQFGWFHPGPSFFYWLAPFYVLGGESMISLNAGAFAMNALALLAIMWVGVRQRRALTFLWLVLWTLIAVFCLRLPDLLTSWWNPNVCVLPLLAIICVGSAVAQGDAALLPLLALLASFVIQTHVGLAPTTLAVAGFAGARFAYRSRRDLAGQRTVIRWFLISLAIIEIVWLLPVAEQVTSPDGNLSRLARFFLNQQGPTQTWRTAWAVWSSTALGMFTPGFHIPVGWAFDVTAPAMMTGIAATILILALAAMTVLGTEEGYQRSLALTCLVASAASFWSVVHVRTRIDEHQVFWISVIGVAAVASVGSAGLSAVAYRWHLLPSRVWVTQGAIVFLPGLVIATAAVTVVTRLEHARQNATLTREGSAAQELARAIAERVPALGSRPVMRLDPLRWPVGVGIFVELDKAGFAFGVDELAGLVGARLSPDGTEDVLVIISGPERHDALIRDPRVHELGSSTGDVYADAVRFSDAPEYQRWWR